MPAPPDPDRYPIRGTVPDVAARTPPAHRGCGRPWPVSTYQCQMRRSVQCICRTQFLGDTGLRQSPHRDSSAVISLRSMSRSEPAFVRSSSATSTTLSPRSSPGCRVSTTRWPPSRRGRPTMPTRDDVQVGPASGESVTTGDALGRGMPTTERSRDLSMQRGAG